MKKVLYIAVIALGTLSISTSCSSDLETFAPGALTEDVAYTKTSDLQQLMNSAYNILTNRSESEFVSVFTDETGIGFANGGQGLTDWYVYFMAPTDGAPNAIWVNNYSALARINKVIKFAENVTPINSNDEKIKQNILAQAYTMRAYCHLVILSYFSTDLKNDSALAGIISDKIFLPDQNDFARNTNGEFYSFIQGDLDHAISLFNTSGYTMSTPEVYGNANFAKGLKARAYAYKGDYANAETWANDVIANSGKALANQSQYQNMFYADSNVSEVIFKFKRTASQNNQDTNLHNAWCSVKPARTGSPFYEISRALFNKLALNTNDIRYATIVSPTSLINPGYATASDYRTSDVLVINKHGGSNSTAGVTTATTGSNAFNNDIKIMRLSEMYFIRAEARANANDLAGVGTQLKYILDSRYGSAQTAPTYANVTAAWKDILDQRRLEFAFEGYRFIDVKRLGTLANSGLDRDAADYSASTSNYPAGNPVNMPLTSYKWTLPIPIAETAVNSLIQQNPGY